MKKGLLLLTLIVLWGMSFAQQYTVSGVVTSSADGTTLPGPLKEQQPELFLTSMGNTQLM